MSTIDSVEIPEMSEALTDSAGYLIAAHAAFELLGSLLKRDTEEESAKRDQVLGDLKENMSEEDRELVNQWNVTLTDTRSQIDKDAAANPMIILELIDTLESATTYFRKYANFLIDNEIDRINREANISTVDPETVKDAMGKLRTEVNAVLVMAQSMGAEIPDDLPLRDDGSYGGNLPRGKSAGTSANKSKGSRLTFFQNGEKIEPVGPRRIQSFIFQHLNPTEGTDFKTLGEFEKMLTSLYGKVTKGTDQRDRTIFDAPWEFGNFRCEIVSE